MKLSKEDIKTFATEDEQKQLTEAKRKTPRHPIKQNNIFLVFKATQYVEDFEESFLGAFTDGKKAYKAADYWLNRKLGSHYTIYQVMPNTDLGLGAAEDVTQDLEDLYGEIED